ncbi:Pre-rRNA-processing protein ipi3 [Pseudogymnoascus destructans]|uniref:Pre-rRNA-processing protein IPI3 n=1 Tax=Pseudogymnoascus destructans TaxID=655981 RepID=A0A177A0V2_9PEZI|nr:Pre-rRNA-processing protein ipi3 [Pseudogymnoascus destructans]OAF55112.1 Pre-rRNA-processing protein ipi3 [Pseudogymnoascus destructans]
MSLSEKFITSIRAAPKSANTAISKDIGIYTHTLHPTYTIDSAFKKSSTSPHCLAVSSTHIFAAQADKAVVHIYSRARANQEALVSFPERIHSLALLHDGLLALGTAEGRVILWEVLTGRQVSTPTSHLQPVTCLSGDAEHLVSGSADSKLYVWSVPALLSQATSGPNEPLRALSNHHAAVTDVVLGHGASGTNICVSASKDNTAIVWNYQTGELLRTFLLPATPTCLALDPCDRAVYIGFENGDVQAVDLFVPKAAANALHDAEQQATPIQVPPTPLTGAPANLGEVHCLGVSYDGTTLVSGHASGKIAHWESGAGKFVAELGDVNAPVTNLVMLDPLKAGERVAAVGVSKPRLGEGSGVFVGQFLGGLLGKMEGRKGVEVQEVGFADGELERAILEFSAAPAAAVGPKGVKTDEALRKENEELWAIVNEQNEVQKSTWSKYRKVASGKVEG